MIKALGELEVVTLFVSDLAESRDFYGRAFSGEVLYEDEVSWVLKLENVMINLLHRGEAAELVEPAALANAASGSRMLLTIKVDSADDTCAKLGKLGIALLNGPTNRPWGRRTAAFADPDGNVWEVAQEIS